MAAEASIRDLEEKAVHVRKARGDRANRQTELFERNAKLDVIRGALGPGADADLEAMFPPPDAIERVQKLATQGLERRARMTAIEDQLANEDRSLADLAARQSERQRSGTSVPLGVTIAEFANLAALCRTIEGAERRAERIGQEIAERVSQLGFENIDCFAAWSCPDGAMIFYRSSIGAHVMLFTHHRHVKEDAEALAARNAATVIDLVSAWPRLSADFRRHLFEAGVRQTP